MKKLIFVLAVFLVGCAHAPMPQPIALSHISQSGELDKRIKLNLSRMKDAYFEPAALAKVSPDWPGDATGRAILALTMLGQATHTNPARLDDLLQHLGSQLNAKGFIDSSTGPFISNTLLSDEQQLSGHSWLLRGLCEHYQWKHDPRDLEMIQKIVTNLLLPQRGQYARYVTDPKLRVHAGNVAGNITNVVNGWKLSSDIGCAFIMIDGATQAYEVSPSTELRELIEEMITRFEQTDLVKLGAQTHATLSATRGILRFYSLTHEEKYLKLAAKTYALYRSKAMTEHYANYNWFGRPEWTEACAVIDSFMVATQLWQFSDDANYLEDAQLIYYNAFLHAQRPNGGFGCDLCVGTNGQKVLLPHEIYEAPFCCSMRGGEGLTRADQYCCFVSGDTVTIPFLHNCEMEALGMKMAVQTTYPNDSLTKIVFTGGSSKPVTLRIFCPRWIGTEGLSVEVNGQAASYSLNKSMLEITRVFANGDELNLTMPVKQRVEPALRIDLLPNSRRYFRGPELLYSTSDDPLLKAINKCTFMSDDAARKVGMKVVFP